MTIITLQMTIITLQMTIITLQMTFITLQMTIITIELTTEDSYGIPCKTLGLINHVENLIKRQLEPSFRNLYTREAQ